VLEPNNSDGRQPTFLISRARVNRTSRAPRFRAMTLPRSTVPDHTGQLDAPFAASAAGLPACMTQTVAINGRALAWPAACG
jgi:hypothetical protein